MELISLRSKGESVKKGVSVFLLAVSIICLTSQVNVFAQETAKFGVILPFSGENKEIGEKIRKGCLIAQDKLNSAGGFTQGIYAGKKLELIFVDCNSDLAKTAEIAEKFVQEYKYPIILGGYSSSSSEMISEVAQKYRVPYLCQTGSADKLTQAGNDMIFRLTPSTSQYTAGLQDFLLCVVKPQTMAILFEDTELGESSYKAMKTFCDANNINIVFEQAYQANSPDYNEMLLSMKLTNPDVVFMGSYLMDAILLVKQTDELGIKLKLIAGSAYGFGLPEFPEGAGRASENVVTAALWAEDVAYKGAAEFVRDYKNLYDDSVTYNVAEGHALVEVLIDVLKRTASSSKEDITAALKATNIETVFAPIQFFDFDNYTNQNRVKTLMMQVQAGKLKTVWPEVSANVKVVYPIN